MVPRSFGGGGCSGFLRARSFLSFRAAPRRFPSAGFRVPSCRRVPCSFCLVCLAFLLLCRLLPVWWSCLCLVRLASVGFVSEGGRRGAAVPLFVRFSFSSRRRDDPRQNEAQKASSDDQGLDHASPRLVRASRLASFSPLLVLLLARARAFFFCLASPPPRASPSRGT